MRFLNTQTRNNLFISPKLAIKQLELWLQQASNQMQSKNWTQAIFNLGCSYESSETLLNLQPLQNTHQDTDINPSSKRQLTEYYVLSGHSIAECFSQNGHHDLELRYLLQLHQGLLKLCNNSTTKTWIYQQLLRQSMQRLIDFKKLHGNFSGYSYFFQQTEKLLAADQ